MVEPGMQTKGGKDYATIIGCIFRWATEATVG